MRIGYFTPSYFDESAILGGGERYPHTLAAGVSEASQGSCVIDLISYGPRAFRRELSPGVSLRILPTSGGPEHPLDAISWEIPQAVTEFDLIHAHQIFTRSTELVALCARQRGIPLVFTDHGGTSSELGHQAELLELADRLICQSDFAASHLKCRRPIDVVKGGVDTRFFTPAEEPPERGYVLFVGRLLPHKGVDSLIQAVPPELPLKLCGRPYHPDFHKYLQSLARGKRVEFITAADDFALRDLYRNAWVNVLPSVYRDHYGTDHLMPELMGFTLLEAMSCGTPAVCTRVGGMPEFIREGETGFVADAPGHLTEILAALAERPDEVERIGKNARREAVEQYDRAVLGKRLLAIYQSLRQGSRLEVA